MEALVVALIPVLQALIVTLLKVRKERKESTEMRVQAFRKVLYEENSDSIAGLVDEQSTRVQQALHNG